MNLTTSWKSLVVVTMLSFSVSLPLSADDDETPLGEQMEELSGSLKRLRRAETAEDKVVLIHKAQEATIKGLAFRPSGFEKMPEGKEKALATADYKKMTAELYVLLCQLEEAVLTDDEEKYDAVYDQIKDMKKSGHKAYKAE